MEILKSIVGLIKWTVDGFKAILQNIVKSMKETLYGATLTSKQTNRYDVYCDCLDENHNIEVLKGKLSPNEQLAFIPANQHMVFEPVIWSKYGKKTMIVSKKQHDNEGLKNEIQLKKTLKGVMEIQTLVTPKTAKIILDKQDCKNIINDWKYDNVWAKIEVNFKGGSIDPTQYDNKYSIPFATQSTLISNSDMIGFLKRASDMTMLTNLIIGALLGYVIKGGVG